MKITKKTATVSANKSDNVSEARKHIQAAVNCLAGSDLSKENIKDSMANLCVVYMDLDETK